MDASIAEAAPRSGPTIGKVLFWGVFAGAVSYFVDQALLDGYFLGGHAPDGIPRKGMLEPQWYYEWRGERFLEEYREFLNDRR